MNYEDIINKIPEAEKPEILRLLRALDDAKKREASRDHFLDFVKDMWPGFISGRHHKIMAEAFERVAKGELKRLIINMPPRHTKSEFASFLLPAWFLGRYPNKKIIQTSHTADLSVNFGRKVRNLVGSEDYQKVFPGIGLQSDSKAAGRWSTNKGGEYFAIGVGGAVTGKGADLLIIDDPHSEQEAMMGQFDVSVYDKVFEWYSSGPRQRLQPGGAIVIVMTRWAKRDLTGQIIQSSYKNAGSSEWEVIELPAIMPSGEPLWPEFWSLDELQKLKSELPISKWSAQYQQDPTSEEGALIKRDWWNVWEGEKAPTCDAVIVALDTAFEKTQRADYSACVTFGVFNFPDKTGKPAPNLILLDAWKEKLEFPELKATVLEHYDC